MTQLIVSCCRHNYPGTCEELLQIGVYFCIYLFNKSQTFFTDTQKHQFFLKLLRRTIDVIYTNSYILVPAGNTVIFL